MCSTLDAASEAQCHQNTSCTQLIIWTLRHRNSYISEAIEEVARKKSRSKVATTQVSTNYLKTTQGIHAKEWLAATKEEVDSLISNKVFKEVRLKDLQPVTKIVSGKWVFKLKPNADGTINIFKARLVA